MCVCVFFLFLVAFSSRLFDGIASHSRPQALDAWEQRGALVKQREQEVAHAAAKLERAHQVGAWLRVAHVYKLTTTPAGCDFGVDVHGVP